MPVEAMLKGDDANCQDNTIEEHTEYESSDMAFFRGFENGPKHSKSEKPSKGTQIVSPSMHMNDMERRLKTYTQVRIMIILVPP
jgi:hypothetical protein